jgi:multiple sugar transport system ATP-binding protein
MAEIHLKDVKKKYGKVTAVDQVNLTVEDKEFAVLVGPSGCGKSTTLRMVAGLEAVTEGEIFIGDREVSRVPPKDRDIAMVFQDYALYPHMNVRKNLSFGLRIRKFPRNEIEQRVSEAARILGIGDLLERKPKELSGGQRQRVAMGRAIVRQPQAFLFDEPLSNLDAKLRVQMRAELAKLHQRLEKTIIYVTHDQVEAMTLASRIVVMNKGRVMQIGSPREVYNSPNNRFVAGFIGSPAMNFLEVHVVGKEGRLFLKGAGFELAIPERLQGRYLKVKDQDAIFGIRPEHIFDAGERSPFPGGEKVAVTVDVSEFVGSETILVASCGSDQITACVDPLTGAKPRAEMEFRVDMNHMYLFDKSTGEVYQEAV